LAAVMRAAGAGSQLLALSRASRFRLGRSRRRRRERGPGQTGPFRAGGCRPGRAPESHAIGRACLRVGEVRCVTGRLPWHRVLHAVVRSGPLTGPTVGHAGIRPVLFASLLLGHALPLLPAACQRSSIRDERRSAQTLLGGRTSWTNPFAHLCVRTNLLAVENRSVLLADNMVNVDLPTAGDGRIRNTHRVPGHVQPVRSRASVSLTCGRGPGSDGCS
jgi:hypothetical protein